MKSNDIVLNLEKKPRVRWSILIMLFAVTVVVGALEAHLFQPNRVWITISLPNPPAPLPDDMAPGVAETAMLNHGN